jgi:polyferredoxin
VNFFLPGLASNHDPPYLCLPSSWDSMHEPPYLALIILGFGIFVQTLVAKDL